MASGPEKEIRKRIRELAKALGITEARAFMVWYAIEAFRLDQDEAEEVISYDGGNDRGIDLLWRDDERERIVIGQSKFQKNSSKHPKVAELALLLDTIDELTDPQQLRDDGRPDLADAAEEFQEARRDGYDVQLQLIYPGAPGADLERRIRSFNRQHLRDNVSASIVDLANLELIHEDYRGAAGRVASGVLELKNGYFEQDGTFGKSLIGSVSGASLKLLYEAEGYRLFDQNVRLFLGTRKGSVNAGIRETLQSTEERQNFWAYNNGITLVARGFKVLDDDQSVELTDFSIVNGCQTTVSIGTESDAAAQHVSVLARIVAPTKQDLVEHIIRFTNSQSPIKMWDLSARDTVQKRLQRELEEMDEPWFYALRRGELDTHPKKEKFGAWGQRRVLEFPLTAQFLAALRGLPVEAYKDKAKLFTKHKDDVFPNDTKADDLLWAWGVGQASERAIKAYKGKIGPDETAEAILRRGARFFVTAVAGQLLRFRNGADVFAKVDGERVTDKAMEQRLDNYAALAASYYVGIMRSLMEVGNELGTLLKNTDTSEILEQRVKERLFEQELAPKALDEALPLLPGIKKRTK